MAKFVDREGRAWRIELSVDGIGHIRRETGVNLNDAFVRDDAGRTPLMRLATDTEGLVAVLYAACEDQVTERGLTPRDFAKAFDGDAVESGIAALSEALCDFFPKHLREPMHRARRKIETRLETNRLSDAELDAIIDRTIETSLPGRATSIGPSTGSPAS